MVDQHILRAAGEPYFILPDLAAFILGVLSHRYSQSTSAARVWVLPTVILIWNLLTWKNGDFGPYWPDVGSKYCGPDCGSSECMYELVVIAPFYTSAAYSLGWATNHHLKTGRELLSIPRGQGGTQTERHFREIQREALEARNQILTKVAVQLIDTGVHPGREDRYIL
jgi:hypothetical protein